MALAQKLSPELESSLSPQQRRGLAEFLAARRASVLDAMVPTTDIDVLRRFQGRVNEIDELRKIISQEK